MKSILTGIATLSLILSCTTTAHADPSGKDAAAGYVGYTGHHWSHDFGVTKGRCDRSAAAAALSEASATEPGGSAVAVLSGLDLPDADRACAAHALELARNHRTIRWKTDKGSAALTTGRDMVVSGLPCRPFVLQYKGKRILGTACQAQGGVWEIQRS